MITRNVITGMNDNWFAGYREERKNEDSPWERSLRSEWVYARNVGSNVSQDHLANLTSVCYYTDNMKAFDESF